MREFPVMDIPAPVDPDQIPTLSGVFRPVCEERDAPNLTVTGELPSDLRGSYIRNGPNPMFPPLGSYTFPIEGDAMLHGIWIDEDGTVRYRNRFVWTPQLRLEEQAGKALWAGLFTPYFPGTDVVPEPYANTFKPAPFINVVHHGGRWLALSEVDPPWEVSDGLEVVGTEPFTWEGAIPGMCAHPRLDPTTNELVFFRYDLTEPYLTWGVIGANGTVTQPLTPIDVDGSYMIHDFVLTRSSIVLFVAPAKFDLNALITGSGPPLGWHGDEPLRVAVVSRDSGAVRWIETEPFWVYHFANGFDDGDEIVIDLCQWSRFALGPAPDQTGAAMRARINTTTHSLSLDSWDDQISEFPRIDDRMQTQPHRFFNYSSKSPGLGQGHYNVLNRVDTATGTVTRSNCGTMVFDEVVFAPAPGGGDEHGYLVAFRTDVETLQSDWAVWDASDVAAGPIATVEMPFRVPAGLHGNWFPA